MLKTIRKSLKLIFSFSRKLFIVNILLTVASGASGYLIILSNKLLLNSIQVFLNNKIYDMLFTNLIYYALLNLITVAIKFVKQYYLSQQRVIIQAQLDYKTMEKNGTFQLEDFENNKIYSLIQSGNELGKDKILDIYVGFTKILEMFVSIIMGTYMMLNLSPDWWILVIFLFPCIKLLVDIHVGKINYKKEKSQIEPYRRISYFNYLISNDIAKKEIVTYRFFDYWFEKFKDIRSNLKNQDISVLKKTSFLVFLVNIIETIIYIFIIGIVVLKRIASSLIGDIFAYIDSIMMIQNNTTELLSYFSDLYKDSLYAYNYFDLIEKKTYNGSGKSKVNKIESIHLKDVSYKYPNEHFELSINNLLINKGNPTVILGKNGSGKTTLLKIISNLYHNFEGEVIINDKISLKEIDCNNYYDMISVLFQDFNKYEATLRENIAMSNTNVFGDEKIMQYISKVGMNKSIEKFDAHLETMMGSWFGDTVFSGGQWQRIAIVRCLIRETDVYILDEPSSALDKNFEKEFFDMLRQYLDNKICVIVIHKLTSEIIKLKPDIVILENGKIKFQGNIQNIPPHFLSDFIE